MAPKRKAAVAATEAIDSRKRKEKEEEEEEKNASRRKRKSNKANEAASSAAADEAKKTKIGEAQPSVRVEDIQFEDQARFYVLRNGETVPVEAHGIPEKIVEAFRKKEAQALERRRNAFYRSLTLPEPVTISPYDTVPEIQHALLQLICEGGSEQDFEQELSRVQATPDFIHREYSDYSRELRSITTTLSPALFKQCVVNDRADLLDRLRQAAFVDEKRDRFVIVCTKVPNMSEKCFSVIALFPEFVRSFIDIMESNVVSGNRSLVMHALQWLMTKSTTAADRLWINPLHVAVITASSVEQLPQPLNADTVNEPALDRNLTPLHFAVLNPVGAITQALIAAGADYHKTSSHSRAAPYDIASKLAYKANPTSSSTPFDVLFDQSRQEANVAAAKLAAETAARCALIGEKNVFDQSAHVAKLVADSISKLLPQALNAGRLDNFNFLLQQAETSQIPFSVIADCIELQPKDVDMLAVVDSIFLNHPNSTAWRRAYQASHNQHAFLARLVQTENKQMFKYLNEVYNFCFNKQTWDHVIVWAISNSKLDWVQMLFDHIPSMSIENKTPFKGNYMDFLVHAKNSLLSFDFLLARVGKVPLSVIHNVLQQVVASNNAEVLERMMIHFQLHPNQLMVDPHKKKGQKDEEGEEEEEEEEERDEEEEKNAKPKSKSKTDKKQKVSADVAVPTQQQSAPTGFATKPARKRVGQNLFHFLCTSRGHPTILKWLLEKFPDADLTAVDQNGKTLLHCLVHRWHSEEGLMKIALDHLIDTGKLMDVVQIADFEGMNVLMCFAVHSYFNSLKRVLDALPSIDLSTTIPLTGKNGQNLPHGGSTLFHLLLNSRHDVAHLVHLLIDRGVNPNQVRGGDKMPPLFFAQDDLKATLLALPTVDVNVSRPDNGYTILHEMIWSNHGFSHLVDHYKFSKERLLLDQKNHDGQTALHLAVIRHKFMIAKWLVSKGCDKNPVAKNGNTPLAEAVFLNNSEMALWLLTVPGVHSNVHVHVDDGKNGTKSQSLFQYAISHSNSDVVSALLADPSVDRNEVMRDALQYRMYDIAKQVVDYLTPQQKDQSLWFYLFNQVPSTVTLPADAEASHLSMCQCLKAAGIPLPSTTTFDCDPTKPYLLHLVVRNRTPPPSESLLEYVLGEEGLGLANQITATDANSRTPFHIAIAQRQLSCVNQLLADARKHDHLSGVNGVVALRLAIDALASMPTPDIIKLVKVIVSAIPRQLWLETFMDHTLAYHWGLLVIENPATDPLWIEIIHGLDTAMKQSVDQQYRLGQAARETAARDAAARRKEKMKRTAKLWTDLTKRKQQLKKLREKKAAEYEIIVKKQPELLYVPVDESCSYLPYHVYVEGEDLYDVLLSKADLTQGFFGHNQFYIMQVLEHNDAKKLQEKGKAIDRSEMNDLYRVVRKWGRVGQEGETKINSFPTPGKAKYLFRTKFFELTDNEWKDRELFSKGRESYDLVQRHYELLSDRKKLDHHDGQSHKGHAAAFDTMDVDQTKKVSTLPTPVKDLVHWITDVKSLRKEISSLGVDVDILPFGKLGWSQIEHSYEVLRAIEISLNNLEQIEKLRGRKRRALDNEVAKIKRNLTKMSNIFYSRFPTNNGWQAPPCIDNKTLLAEKISLLDSMGSVFNAMDFIEEQTLASASSNQAWEDIVYANLGTDIKELPKDSDMFKTIVNYIHESQDRYSPKVEAIFKLSRWEELSRFEQYAQLRQKTVHGRPHNMLLFHGSSVSNILSILASGLKIAPLDAPLSGAMFGRGVYFADMFAKSVGYCRARTGEPSLMLLAEVALGESYERTSEEYMDAPPAGFLSTKGVGHQGGGRDLVRTPKGVGIPIGTVNSDRNDVVLNYNEFIVYDISQVKLKYLISFRV